MKTKKIMSALSLLMLPFMVIANDITGSQVEMADLIRSNGKIYIVVTVLVIIMAGLLLYLINLDFKLNKLEKRISSKNPL